MMRLVYVAPFFPYPPHAGATIRVWNTLLALSQHHTIDLVIQDVEPSDSVAVASVRALVRSLTFVPRRAPLLSGRLAPRGSWAALVDMLRYPPSYLRRYWSRDLVRCVGALLAKDGGADWLLCDTQLSGQVALSSRLPRAPRALCLFDLYDTLSRRKVATTPFGPYKVKFVVDWLKARRYERKIMRRFDVLTVVSAQDERLARAQHAHARVVLIPNGVDVEYFQPAPRGHDEEDGSGAATRYAVLFVGNLAYEPNHEGVRDFLREIWPLVRGRTPEARFIVVGAYPPDWLREVAERDPSVIVTGEVADVRPFYREARVVVVPLRLGAGTKLKVLEALAMGVPVVTTPQGRMGLDAEDSCHLFVATTPEQFAARVVDILHDRALAQPLVEAGRALVEQRYGRPAIMASFEEALRQGRGTASEGEPSRADRAMDGSW